MMWSSLIIADEVYIYISGTSEVDSDIALTLEESHFL